MPRSPYPNSLDQLLRMTKVAQEKLANADDAAGMLSLAASANEDEEALDLIDGLRDGDRCGLIVAAGGVPGQGGAIPLLDYIVMENADGLWAAAAQAVLTCAFEASQGPTRDFGTLLSEAERALRRARVEQAVEASQLSALPAERALCREKLRRARYLVALGLDARTTDDRHQAVQRLQAAHRIGL